MTSLGVLLADESVCIGETAIDGAKTNLAYLALVLSHPRFEAEDVDVEFVERHVAEAAPLNGRVSDALDSVAD